MRLESQRSQSSPLPFTFVSFMYIMIFINAFYLFFILAYVLVILLRAYVVLISLNIK